MLSVCIASKQNVERSLLLLVVSASDIPLRTIKFFSVIFSSAYSSMMMLQAVTNKHSLVRRRLCDLHCIVVGNCFCHFVLVVRTHFQQSIDSQLLDQNRDFCLYPTCIFNDLEQTQTHISRSGHSLTISEMATDTAIITMKGEWETVPKLSNGTTFNDLE